jgi:hypothetical protein
VNRLSRHFPKDHARETSSVFAMMTLSIGYSMVDQVMAARISPDYLFLLNALAYVSIGYVLFARLLGQIAVVLLSKDPSAETMNSAINVYAPLTLVAAVLIACRGPFAKMLGISHIAGWQTAFEMQIVAGFLIGFSLYLKFILLAKGYAKASLSADIVGNLLNLAANLIAIFAFNSPAARFLGCLAATVVIQCLLIAWYARLLYRHAPWGIGQPLAYLLRARAMLTGEAFYVLLGVVAPFIITVALGQYLTADYVNAFNVGNTLAMMLDRPFMANLMTSTARMAKANLAPAHLKEVILESRKLNAVFALAALPIAAAVPFLVPVVYGMHGTGPILLVMALIVGSFLRAMNGPWVSLLKARERHAFLAVLDATLGQGVTFVLALAVMMLGWAGRHEEVLPLMFLVSPVLWTAAIRRAVPAL